MKRILLTQGQFAIVDDADYDWLNQWKWRACWAPSTKSFYAIREGRLPDGRTTTISMHRLILGLEHGNKLEAHHKNHDTLVNQRQNLQSVTHQQNQWNQKAPKGYYWEPLIGKYRAYIKVDGRLKYLGSYKTPELAHAKYLTAKEHYHAM